MSEKTCNKCGETKPVSQFNLSRGRPRGECKICHRASVVKWQRDNRSRYRRRASDWHARNREKSRAYSRASYKKMTPEAKRKKADYAAGRYLQRKYGISKEQWAQMYEAQGGVCALCKVPGRTGRHDKLAVDHCHETGRVRGLLCAACNVSLGILGDNPEKLRRALNYVTGGQAP